MWAMSFCTWILFVLAMISFQGLHSYVEIFMREMFTGGDMCLGSLFGV